MKRFFATLKSSWSTQDTMPLLLKILMIVTIVYVISISTSFWLMLFSKVRRILTPFILGFLFAYLLNPWLRFLSRKKISKKVSVPLTLLVIFVGLFYLLTLILPRLYVDFLSFIQSLTLSVNQVFDWYRQTIDRDLSPFMIALKDALLDSIDNLSNFIPDLTSLIPRIIANALSFITTLTFSIIIAMYMMHQYDTLTQKTLRLAKDIKEGYDEIIYRIHKEVSVYFRGLAILMIIKLVEYSLLYYLIGHRNWLIIGLLTSIGLLVPYLGATVANGIGIVTALYLPFPNVVVLLIGIAILADIDAYIIGPFVHSKNSQVPPLWTLFSILTGGILFGPVGIIIAVPGFMAIRVLIRYRREHMDKVQYE